MGFSAGDHRFDSVCLPCAPWVNWLARSQLKCPSGVFVLGARGEDHAKFTHRIKFRVAICFDYTSGVLSPNLKPIMLCKADITGRCIFFFLGGGGIQVIVYL